MMCFLREFVFCVFILSFSGHILSADILVIDDASDPFFHAIKDKPHLVLHRLRNAQEVYWTHCAQENIIAETITDLSKIRYADIPVRAVSVLPGDLPASSALVMHDFRKHLINQEIVDAFSGDKPLCGYNFFMPTTKEMNLYPALSGNNANAQDLAATDNWAACVSFIASPAKYGETSVFSYCIGSSGIVVRKDMGRQMSSYSEFGLESPFSRESDWVVVSNPTDIKIVGGAAAPVFLLGKGEAPPEAGVS